MEACTDLNAAFSDGRCIFLPYTSTRAWAVSGPEGTVVVEGQRGRALKDMSTRKLLELAFAASRDQEGASAELRRRVQQEVLRRLDLVSAPVENM